MNCYPLVVSFYTKDTPYQFQAEALEKTCQHFDIAYEMQGVPSAGSWEANCAFKPIFILEMLLKHKRSLLWVDSDAVFVKKLAWCEAFSADLAIRVNHELQVHHPSKIITSTMFVAYNAKTLQLMKSWGEKCIEELLNKDRQEEMWDQKILTDVLQNTQSAITVAMLPIAYLKIFDHPEDEKNCCDPIIVQNQASRVLKKWVNGFR